MKKLMLTAIVVVSMSLASFANNSNAMQCYSNGSNIESIEKAGPHTKQYQDIMKLLDEFEQSIKKATSCEELDNAELAMLFKLMALTENKYTEDATPEETKEIQEMMERLESDAQKLKQQWGCEPEGDENTDKE